jgi:hypothetical protein
VDVHIAEHCASPKDYDLTSQCCWEQQTAAKSS